MTLVMLHVPRIIHALTCAACQAAGGAEASNICSACKSARYCNATCQRADWKRHKPICQAIVSTLVRAEEVAALDKTIKPFDDGSVELFRRVGALRKLSPAGAVVLTWLAETAYGKFVAQLDTVVAQVDSDGTAIPATKSAVPGHCADAVHGKEFASHPQYHLYTRAEFAANSCIPQDVKDTVTKYFVEHGARGCAWVNCLRTEVISVWFGTIEEADE